MPRTLLIFVICLPLAVLMGFMLADPMMSSNMMVAGSVIGLLALPLVLSAHHRALIWLAGAAVNAFFLPGQPQMWMVVGGLSLVISLVSRPLGKGVSKPVFTPHLAGSLIFISVVTLMTAKLTGGIGLKVLGSSVYGGKKYAWVLAAVVGFFALTMQRANPKTINRDVSVFALSSMTTAMSNLAYMLGPAFYFLFLLFPVEIAISQAAADIAPDTVAFKRIGGFGPASVSLVCFCLMRWGLRGILEISKPWRMFLVMVAMALGMASGFRSNVVMCLLLFVVQFFVEGLHKTRYVFAVLGAAAVSFALLASFSESLPLSAQRAICFLPVRVDPLASADAANSIEWRLEMWKVLIKELPRYFWLGKGYAIDPTDIYFAEEGVRRGFDTGYDASMKAGDYHSGPLSVIIPFGIWGVIGFVWFCCAGFSALWKNLKHGDPQYRNINTYLFSYFVMKLIFFNFFFGAFPTDLWGFCSYIGLSLTINNGVRQPPAKPRPALKKPEARQRAEVLAGI